MWPNFGWFIVFMREVIITRILYKFDQKTRFFYEGCSWFKFNNLRMALDMALKFYSCVEKRLKLKVQSVEETRRSPPPPPPILNSVESTLKDFRPVKTITTTIILGNMIGNIKSAVFTNGGAGEGESYCWACMFGDAQYWLP